MADDFSFLTDSDDERAVEDVLAQAMDHSVLEQLAAINCSSFSTADNLPAHLETRFRKLKSLPTTTATSAPRFPPVKSKSLTPRSADESNLEEQHPDRKKGSPSCNSTDTPEEDSAGYKNEGKGTESKSLPTTNTNPNPNARKSKGSKSKPGTVSGSSTSGSDSWSPSSPESASGALSPPRRKIGCLWCYPKKPKSVSRKQGKENRCRHHRLGRRMLSL